MTSEDTVYLTSDLGIAAFLKLKGIKLIDCKRLDSGRFHFSFDDPNNECQSLAMEFLESDFCKYDNITRNLKKLLFR